MFSMYSATEYFAIIRHKLRREFRCLQGQNADVRVEGGQRRPGRLVLSRSRVVQADNRGVRVQGDLQVQDVIDDVLQDFHLGHLLVLRDAGHQFLELGVAVVHVVEQTHRVVYRGLAPGDAQAVVRQAVFPNGPHRTEGFHAARRRRRRGRGKGSRRRGLGGLSSGCRNVPVRRPGGCFQAKTGALGADGVRPETETEEPASRQLVPAMARSSRTPDGKTNG